MKQVIYPIPANALITAIGTTALYMPVLASNLAGVDATFSTATDIETNEGWLIRTYEGTPVMVSFIDPVTDLPATAQEQAADFIGGHPQHPPIV